jgi:hypothetical protein
MAEDRELLELAAKAAGIDLQPDPYSGLMWVREKPEDRSGLVWNPLEYSGDALELAVRLRIDVQTEDDDGLVGTLMPDGRQGPCQQVGNDPLAATRRAIVRAAAEIGRSMSNG